MATNHVNQSFDISAASAPLPKVADIKDMIKLLNTVLPNGPGSLLTPQPTQTPKPIHVSRVPQVSETESHTPIEAASHQPPSPNETQNAETQPAEPAKPAQMSAVTRCCKAYNQAYQAACDRRLSDYDSKKEAERAFAHAMPRLNAPENINDFIACVAYAMLTDIIRPENGTKILYAAQVATQANQVSQKIANHKKSFPETPK